MKKLLAKLVLFGLIAASMSLSLNAYAENSTSKEYPICIYDENGAPTCYSDEWCKTHFYKDTCEGISPATVKAEVECMQGEFGDPSQNCEQVSYNQSTNYSSALDDATKKPCIQEVKYDNQGNVTGGKGPDDGYIITFLEEPLTLKNSTTTTQKQADFESRICFRNYFSFTTGDKKEHTITELSTICSKNGTTKLTNSDAKKRNAKFGCQPIQVLLSKGGTSLIKGYISLIYKWAASIVGLIAVVVIIYSGLQISLGGGESEAITDAKKRIIQSLAGLALLFLSGLILNTINPNFFI